MNRPQPSQAQIIAAALTEVDQIMTDLNGEPMPDNKTEPSHYRGFSNGAQPVDIAERLNFNRGTALVYIARAGRKHGESAIDDLKKARWFLDREINRIVSDGKEVPDGTTSE